MKFDGKVILISGGATLIGEVVARKFLTHGAKVVLCDNNEAAGELLSKSLGEQFLFIPADV